MSMDKELEKIIEAAKRSNPANPKGMDITDIIAGIKDMCMELPKAKIQRQEMIKKIAEGFQKKQGFFFFDQIFDILETAYRGEVSSNEEQIVQEIDEWVSDLRNAEFLGEENGCYYYRLV